MKQNDLRQIAKEWERAVEHAAEEMQDTLLLNDASLHDAAGLHIQSGVKGGGWTHTCSCGGSCASQCACE